MDERVSKMLQCYFPWPEDTTNHAPGQVDAGAEDSMDRGFHSFCVRDVPLQNSGINSEPLAPGY